MDAPLTLLPGQTLDRSGRPKLDYAVVARLAFPFMVNSAVQAVLNATDTWFIGRLSPDATAAIGAVYWPVLMFVLLLGGVAQSVQTLVAQAYGGRRYTRAAQATWTALWASAATLPVFAALAVGGAVLFAPFGIAAHTLDLALQYWYPRMLGAPLGIALWSLLGFFNGIGRPAVSLRITLCVALANVLLNQLFVVELSWGIAGSAWATGVAQVLGLGLALWVFLGRGYRSTYRPQLTFRLRLHSLIGQFKLGFPMGVLYAADIGGFALFQLMQVHLSTVEGAATQLVMMITSFCFMPAVGIAMAGTTLVGQAIGAGTPDWATRMGNGIILITVIYMGTSGLLLAAAGPWVIPWFTNHGAEEAPRVIALGCHLLWISSGYQLFDGLNLASGACLRGAGDVRLPSIMVLLLSWGFFVPLAHALSFSHGAGWVDWLPQWGFGAVGGWFAAVAYICCLGTMLFFRWHSDAWRRLGPTLP